VSTALPPPALGEQFMPVAGEHLRNPYPFFERARLEQPVFFSPVFHMWFVTRYDDVMTVLMDPQTYSSRDTIPTHPDMAPEVKEALAGYRNPRHLINADPPDHTRMRSLMNHAFIPRRVAALEPSIRDIAGALIDGFIDRGRADLIDEFAYPLPLTVILRMLGVPPDDMDSCRRWSNAISEWAWGQQVLPVERLAACARGMVEFMHYTEALVESRHREPRDDMISHLLAAREDGVEPLGAEALVDIIPGLILAGHETTANLIGNTMTLLLSESGQWDELTADTTLVDRAIEEGLRMDASVTGMPRTVTRDVELGGMGIPAGSKLFLLYGSANHDEAHFSHPEAFDVHRDRGAAHFAFGRGIHYCIGAPLARLEARVAIELLARRLPGLRLDPEQDFARKPNLLFRGLAQLNVTWDIVRPTDHGG